MHSLLKHLHGGDQHSPAESAAPTTGNVIHWANRYDRVVQIMALGQARRLRRKTIEFAQIAPAERVLDVGCGTGDLTLLAKTRSGSAGQVCGIDPSPEMIGVARRKAARQKADVDFRVGVIERLPYSDGSFDVVLSSLMMHHLPADLKPLALAEIRRVLKPGGRLAILDFMNLLEQQGVVALVNAAGFTPSETRRTLFNTLGLVLAQKA
jgi:demethylmenaquinone methyltransferase/2-methoxy-6-polyprenyl-1,4-benzoquinol methylase/phosphoethanolamine N-methyltransferase